MAIAPLVDNILLESVKVDLPLTLSPGFNIFIAHLREGTFPKLVCSGNAKPLEEVREN